MEMNRSRAAAIIAIGSLLVGLAADVLLRWVPWGINAALFTALFIGAAFMACRAAGRRIHPFAAIVAGLAAIGIAWRDSPVLVALDVALLLLFLPLLALGARGVQLASAGLSQLALAAVTTGVQAVAGLPQLVVLDLKWSDVPRVRLSRGVGVFFRGVGIAAPALVLFGSLLVAADAAFAELMRTVLYFELDELFLHLFVTAIAAAICAGFLRSFALSGAAPMPPRPSFLHLGAAETNVALALIDVLFAAFVMVQFRYFFGGSESMRIGEMTYSEYARRGFFELVWVVALVVPMLLAAEWLVSKESPRAVRVFRALALVQVALVLTIGASAYRRMQLYRDAFGLTQLRLYTTAFMIFIGAVLVWLAVTVLAGKRTRFAFGFLTAGVVTIAVLHAINPDAVIVETNLARARSGVRPFDGNYALQLSDDAADAIMDNAKAFDPRALARFIDRPRPKGWRTWNWSRARAALRVEGYPADRTPVPRRGIDPRVQQLPQVRHLQKEVPVADAVHGDGEEEHRQHGEKDLRGGRGGGERRR